MKVYIDCGHGGNDSGALNKARNILEKNVVLEVCKLLDSKLKKCGLDVKLSRYSDITKSLAERTTEANKWGADCLISIHINDASKKDAHGNKIPDTSAQGLETFCYKFKYRKLADYVHEEMIKAGLYTKDRKVKEGNLHMIRESNMSAALIELFFINNDGDLNKLLNKKDEFATAIAKAICRFLEVEYKYDTILGDNNKLYKIVTGGFGTKNNAEAQAEYLRSLTKWYLEVKEIGNTGDYCIHTGGFTGEDKVKRKLDALVELTNWWAVYQLE